MKTEILNILLNTKAPITAICNRCLKEMKEEGIKSIRDQEIIEETIRDGVYSIYILRCENNHTVFVLKRHIKFPRKIRSYKHRKPGGPYRVVRVTPKKESKLKRLLKKLDEKMPLIRSKKVVSIELSGSEDVKRENSAEDEEEE